MVIARVVLVALCFGPQDTDERVRQWSEKLRSEKLEEREEAVTQLAKIGEPARRAMEALINDADGEVRGRAQAVLLQLDALVRRKRLLEKGVVPDRLRRVDPTFVDRMVSLLAKEREEALMELTGLSMDQLRAKIIACDPPKYCLPEREYNALVGEFRAEIEEICRISAANDPSIGRECLAMVQPALPWVLGNLKHADPKRRALAVAICFDRKIAEAAPTLVELLKDADIDVVLNSISALARLGNPAHGPRIAELLTHPEPKVRAGALYALADLRDADARPAVLKMEGDNPDLKRCIGVFLCSVAGKDDIDLLAEWAREEGVCRTAVEELARRPGPQSTQVLIRCLEGLEGVALGTAAGELARRKAKEAAPALRLAIDRVREEKDMPDRFVYRPNQLVYLVYALRDVAGDNADALFGPLLDWEETEQAALNAIADLRLHKLAPQVVKALKQGKPGTQRQAAATLLALDYRDSAELRSLLGDLDASIRPWVASKIVAIEGKKGMGGFLQDPVPAVRAAALRRLARERTIDADPEAIVALLQGAETRAAALSAIRARDLRQAAEKLVALLDPSETPLVLVEALRTLGGWKEEKARPKLKALLGHASSAVRFESVRAAAALKASELLEEITKGADPGEFGSEICVRAIGDLGSEKNLDLLDRLILTSHGAEAARSCVRILSKGRPEGILPYLRDNDEMLRIGAVRLVRELRLADARPELRRLLDGTSSELANEALLALLDLEDRSPQTLRAAKKRLEAMDVLSREGCLELLFLLNRIRDPKTFAFLSDQEIQCPLGGTFESLLDAMCLLREDVGRDIRISPRVVGVPEATLHELKYSRVSDLLRQGPVLFDEGGLLLVDESEAVGFWSEWIDRELRK